MTRLRTYLRWLRFKHNTFPFAWWRLFCCLTALALLAGCDVSGDAGYWKPSSYAGKKILCRITSGKQTDPYYECIDADLSKVKP